MAKIVLPGLERLMDVCRKLAFRLVVEPAGRMPPKAGMLLGKLPLDPILATVYAHIGQAAFATDVAGFILFQHNDTAHDLERHNAWWREDWQEEFALPLVIFGGEPLLAHYYATVPALADARGYQPVVRAETYEQPYALPLASNVDRLFDTYSHYLEALVATPGYESEGATALVFPWDVPHLLSRDERLVELMRAGRFDSLMKSTDEVRQWVANVVGTP